MEITKELAKAYLLDRCKELQHDCKAGTPFVFLNAMTLLNVLSELQPTGFISEVVERFMPQSYKGMGKLIEETWDGLTHNLSLPVVDGHKINLTHDNSQHLKKELGKAFNKITLAAECFVDDVETAVENCMENLDNESEALKTLNKYKFVGYGA